MPEIPQFLTDEAIDRANALGRAVWEFLLRRDREKALDPAAKVEPDAELMRLISEGTATDRSRRTN